LRVEPAGTQFLGACDLLRFCCSADPAGAGSAATVLAPRRGVSAACGGGRLAEFRSAPASEPRLRLYHRTGEPCPRCARPIRRTVIAGRSSHFCPRCQPHPRYVASARAAPLAFRSQPRGKLGHL
jgi:hypothetical protein